MNCPNCNYGILKGNICGNCGIDVVIFDKTIKISDVLYNKGLNLAKINDMWGAIDSLTKSIQFNKNNFYARNLLGLVYYEIGRIGDALKHWVISASLVKTENPAVKYINQVQKESKQLDLFNDAIDMYNNALLYLQQRSDDMAIIQLKKAVELNPKFVDAMNLLTFCHLIQNQRDMAGVLCEKVLEIDINNPVAINYYKELYPQKVRPKVTQPRKEVWQSTAPAAPIQTRMTEQTHRKLFGDHFYFAEIISFIIGGLCTGALIYTLVIPGTFDDRDNTIITLQEQIAQFENTVAPQLSESLDTIARLQGDLDEERKKNDDLQRDLQVQDNVRKVDAASQKYNSGNVIEAAGDLSSLDPSGLPEVYMSSYNQLKEEVYPAAALELYTAGLNHYNALENEDAKRTFVSCLVYAAEDADYIDDVTFYLGQLAEREEEIEQAISYYRLVVANHPNSPHVSAANARLAELE